MEFPCKALLYIEMHTEVGARVGSMYEMQHAIHVPEMLMLAGL